ncbi:MAG: prepilin-type N-terminal cleavage/methylation domain-containing protein, partial [Candidatus Dadabacteria bacterium]|nr:prepilin-type N-terminal cleavage/methylation domain-containing protein [Candidatus Dadabacteria bacterium]
MSLLRNQRGFTFTEIIIAISIMALGFLAMAQMQYLSLRQKQRAEQGTVATNIIQFIADRDIERVKRSHLLNSIAFVEAQAGRLNAGSS